MAPRAGAQFDHPVGGADDRLVVLDDHHRVAGVAHRGERRDQAPGVLGVQPHARLVQHVEHAGQPAAELGGDPDPLRLAPRERAAGAVERQVAEPDLLEKPEPRAHRGRDLAADVLAVARQAQFVEPLQRLLHRQPAEVVDPQPAAPGALDPHRQHLGPQPPAAAGAARPPPHHPRQAPAHRLAGRFAQRPLGLRAQPLEPDRLRPLLRTHLPAGRHLPPVQQHRPQSRGQPRKARVRRQPRPRQQRPGFLAQPPEPPRRRRPPAAQPPVQQRRAGVGD